MVAQPTRTSASLVASRFNSSMLAPSARRFVRQVFLSGVIVPLALLFGGLSSSMQAQTINCAPTAECSWNNGSSTFTLGWYVSPGCDGCNATVNYRYRSGCNNGNDCEIEILSISFSGTCNNCTIGSIIRYSVIQAMITTPCGYPELGQCVENVQVWMAACQKKTHLGDGSYVITPCYSENCCSAKYKLCRLGTGGVLTLTRTDLTLLPSQPCDIVDLDTFYPPSSFGGCFMSCDGLPVSGDIELQ